MNNEACMQLFHGSRSIVVRPIYGFGSEQNDYGRGFYCTESHDLACEWACPTFQDGIVNSYSLDCSGLCLMDLDADDYGVLPWLALLVKNRRFDEPTPLVREAKAFLLREFLPDTSVADVIIGYRADDSYFSFARAFLDNRLSLSQLEQALLLGDLGRQIVPMSKKAFDSLTHRAHETVDARTWHPRRKHRDDEARRAYRKMQAESTWNPEAIYMADLLRRDARNG